MNNLDLLRLIGEPNDLALIRELCNPTITNQEAACRVVRNHLPSEPDCQPNAVVFVVEDKEMAPGVA